MIINRPMTTLALLRGALQPGGPFPVYFALDDVDDWLVHEGVRPLRHTLHDYLSDLAQEGRIFDAGRGWYCLHADRPVLDRTAVEKLELEMAGAFPFLPCCLWHTTMLNPWMHHLVGAGSTYLHVERDAFVPVAEHLEAAGWRVAIHPLGDRHSLLPRGEHGVIMRPLHAHVPRTGGRPLQPEQILVDLCREIAHTTPMDREEFEGMAYRLATETRLLVAPLVAYMRRRRLTLTDLFGGRAGSLFSANAFARLDTLE